MNEKRLPVLRAVEEWEPFSPLGEKQVARAIAFFNSPGRISKVISIKETGLNRHSRNRWYRWTNTEVQSVRRNENGRFITYTRHLKHRSANLNYFALDADLEWKNLFKQEFGLPFSYAAIHPLAPHYDLDGMYGVSPGFSGSLKEADLRAQVTKLFGKTRVRRDLLRAVAGSHDAAIMYAREFRGLVPIDWIVNFLQNNPRVTRNGVYTGGFRTHLYTMDRRSYRDLLQQQLLRHDWMELQDITRVRPWQQAVGITGRFRNITEVHNALFAQHRFNYKPIEPKEVPKTPLYSVLQGATAGPYSFVLPTLNTDLVEWGQEMRNCIGSYTYELVSAKRSRELGGIYQGERLIGNFEIFNGELRQLLGKCNTPLNRETRDLLTREFKAKGITVPNDYWGAREVS